MITVEELTELGKNKQPGWVFGFFFIFIYLIVKGNVQLLWNLTLCSEQGEADKSFIYWAIPPAILSMNAQSSLRWKTQSWPSPLCSILPGAF